MPFPLPHFFFNLPKITPRLTFLDIFFLSLPSARSFLCYIHLATDSQACYFLLPGIPLIHFFCHHHHYLTIINYVWSILVTYLLISFSPEMPYYHPSCKYLKNWSSWNISFNRVAPCSHTSVSSFRIQSFLGLDFKDIYQLVSIFL